jgi:putative oxidoreductase
MQKPSLIFGHVDLPGIPANLGLAILRVLAGASMAFAHGWGKVPPPPGFVDMVEKMGFPVAIAFAWAAAFAEFGGGLLVAIGLATRPAALLVTMNMGVAAFIFHASDPFAGPRELALLFGAVFLLFTLLGAGRLSVDAMIRKS